MNLLKSRGYVQQKLLLFSSIRSEKYITSLPQKYLDIETKWKERDSLPKRWNLIYKAPMANVISGLTTYLTVSTGIVAVASAYYAYNITEEELAKPVILGEELIVASSPYEALIYLISLVGFHIIVKVFLSRYVIRLYQDGDKYTAIFRSHMFNSITKHEFHLNEFKRRPTPFLVSWGHAQFALGNKKAIILENYFKTPADFNYLLNKRKRNEPDIE